MLHVGRGLGPAEGLLLQEKPFGDDVVIVPYSIVIGTMFS